MHSPPRVCCLGSAFLVDPLQQRSNFLLHIPHQEQDCGSACYSNVRQLDSNLKGIYKEILEIEKKCGLPPITWRVHVVRNFIQQQNDKDCGVFVMFLFQTLALGNSVILPYKGLCKNELDNFREWVAFLLFIGRIQRD